MKKTNEKITKELLENTDNNSSYQQKFACFQTICDIVDNTDDKAFFLIELKEFLIDYLKS